jgi:hypothetical protein
MRKSLWMMPVVILLLMTGLARSARAADIIENLQFTGTATCAFPASCTALGFSSGGPLTGTYTLDVTTQTITGPWSFSTPAGVFSSSDAGASASTNLFATNEAFFEVFPGGPTDFNYLALDFAANDELGALVQNNPPSHPGLCPNTGTPNACSNLYTLTGSNSLVGATPTPEPGTFDLTLTGLGLLAMTVVLMRKRKPQGSVQTA